MTTKRELAGEDAAGAAAIQAAIDSLGSDGGHIVLPAMDLTLDRGIELRSRVELSGQGEGTTLRKGPGRVYPLSGYHNYGMCDVPLRSTQGLAVGMTVCVLDDLRRGFYETFARITWIDGPWVGLDHGTKGDYLAADAPRLTTAHPLVFGHGIAGAAVRDLRLEGSRADQDEGMGGCRGGAIYFAASRDIEITGIRQRDFSGEGLSFQMCRDVVIRDSVFDANSGNGMHPGAGSTNCLFANSSAAGNGRSGFFFCVRANHITVKDCSFEGNGLGVSVGTRDCHNVVESCRILRNSGEGVLFRPEGVSPVEVHSVRIAACEIEGNALEEGEGQVALHADAHDIVIEGNRISGNPDRKQPAVFAAPATRDLYCTDNTIDRCDPPLAAAAASLTAARPEITGGYGTAPETAYRHLTPVHI